MTAATINQQQLGQGAPGGNELAHPEADAPAAATVPDSPGDIEIPDFPFQPHIRQFVAYQKEPTRIGDAQSGTALTARAEVLVRTYNTIRIASIEDKSKGSNNGDTWSTLYVKFDAASVGVNGFERDFGASAAVGTGVERLLRWAHDTSSPICVAVETKRRAKTKSDRQAVPVTDGIRVLRQDADGKESANVTGENCFNVIAAIGVVGQNGQIRTLISPETVSEHTEWEQLTENKDGSLPPDGWRRLTSTTDPRMSMITPIDSTSAASGTEGGVTAAALESMIAGALSKISVPTPGPTRSGMIPRREPAEGPVSTHRAVEARQWDAMNSDNRVNAGSYLMSKQRATFALALDLVAAALGSPGAPAWDNSRAIDRARGLTAALLWVTDRVHEQVVPGLDVADRRLCASHKEAGQWVRHTIETQLPLPVVALTDPEAHKAWANAIAAAAGDAFRWAYAAVSDAVGAPMELPETAAVVHSGHNRELPEGH